MDLALLARKHIWWQPPDRALRDRRRLVAQVMNIGTFADAEALRTALGDEAFKQALREARAGEFSSGWPNRMPFRLYPEGSCLELIPQARRPSARTAHAVATPDTEVARRSFVLYGGTAVALYLGHRESVDFDFFTHLTFQPDERANLVSSVRTTGVLESTNLL